MKNPLLLAFVLFLLTTSVVGQTSYHIDEELPLGAGAPKNVPCGVDQFNNVISYPWYIPPASRKEGNTISSTTCGSFTLIFADEVLNTGQG